MTLKLKLLAFAAVVGFAVSGWAADTELPWFGTYTFDTGIDSTMYLLTNTTSAIGWGEWDAQENDESDVVGTDIPVSSYDGTTLAVNQVLKLNTQGQELTFTPFNGSYSNDMVKTIIDADIYFVGSDNEPTPGFEAGGFDDKGDVQTAVFLKTFVDDETTDETNWVFCAYVYVQGSGSKWIELEFDGDPGVITNNNWYKLRIEIDYSTDTPIPLYYINDIPAKTDNYTYIANTSKFEGGLSGNGKIKSISFKGTGYVDNFVGSQVLKEEIATFKYYVKGFIDMDPIGDLGDVMHDPSYLEAVAVDSVMEFDFFDTYYDEFGAEDYVALTMVRVISSIGTFDFEFEKGFTGAYTNGPTLEEFVITCDSPKGTFTVDTALLEAPMTIEFYYGDAGGGLPMFEDPYKTSGNSIKHLLVIGGGYADDMYPWDDDYAPVEIEGDYFVVRVVSAGAYITYSLIEIDDLATKTFESDGAVDDPVLGFGSDDIGEIVTLKSSMFESDEVTPKTKAFFKVKANWTSPND